MSAWAHPTDARAAADGVGEGAPERDAAVLYGVVPAGQRTVAGGLDVEVEQAVAGELVQQVVEHPLPVAMLPCPVPSSPMVTETDVSPVALLYVPMRSVMLPAAKLRAAPR